MITYNRSRAPLVEHARRAPAADDVRHDYRELLHRVGWPGDGPAGGLRTVGVTSCYDGEGVSTVAAELATAAAAVGQRPVLLVDGNLAAPAQDRRFRLQRSPGLAELLGEQVPAADPVQPTPIANLSLLSAGTSQLSARSDASLERVLEALVGRFELLVVDLPSAAAWQGVEVAQRLDGVLLVVESERVPWPVALRTRQQLADAGVRLVGVVLNKTRRYLPRWLDGAR